MLEELRKRDFTFGELLVKAWNIFSKNFKTILFINLLIFFPLCLVENVVGIKIQPLVGLIDQYNSTDGGNMQFIFDAAAQIRNYNLAISLLGVVVLPLGMVAIAKMVENHLYEKKFRYKDVILFALGKGVSIIWVSLLSTLLIGIGILAFVIPGIILSICWIFGEYEVALGQEKGYAALKESGIITAGKRWNFFGYTIVFGFLSMGVSFLLDGIIPDNGNVFGIRVLLGMIGYLFQSFTMVFWAVLYINLKLVTKRFLTEESERSVQIENMTEDGEDFLQQESNTADGVSKYPWEEKEGYSPNKKE